MKPLIFCIFLISAESAFSCLTDVGCRIDQKCIKAQGDLNMNGVCVFVDNSSSNWGSSEPTEVPSCFYHLDCDLGEKCFKRPGQINGFCVKKRGGR